MLASACNRMPEGVKPIKTEGEETTPKNTEPTTPKTPEEPQKPQNLKVFTAKDLKVEMLIDGVLTIPSEYGELAPESLKGRTDISALVAEGVIKVGDNALEQCTKLKRVLLPKATHLGSNVFWKCYELRHVGIPKVEYIGGQAFYAVLELEEVVMGSRVPQASSDAFKYSTVGKVLSVAVGSEQAFRHFASTHRFASIKGANPLQANFSPLPTGSEVEGTTFRRLGGSGEHITDLVLNPLFTKIDVRACWEASNLHGSFASNGVTEIAEAGLMDCPNLQVLDMPQLRKLGRQALARCSRMAYINIPKVEELGQEALELCYRIERLNMPQLKSLGDGSLASCQRLKEIRLGATPPRMGTGVFGNSQARYGIQPGQITLIVPKGSRASYETWRRSYPQIGKIEETN